LDDVVATVISHGLEHHFILFPGHELDLLGEFATWAGLTELGRRPGRRYLRAEDFT
jgi:hypothetical protein